MIYTIKHIFSRYFAAPPQDSTVHRYDISEHIAHYEEIDSIRNEENGVSQQNQWEEDDKGETEEEGLNAEELESSEDGYQTPHDYIEVL